MANSDSDDEVEIVEDGDAEFDDDDDGDELNRQLLDAMTDEDAVEEAVTEDAVSAY
jgi:hypothetical protein